MDAADRDDYWRAATRPFYVTERSSRDAPLHGTMFGSATGTSLIGETTFSSQNYVRNRRLITESELDDHYLVQGWTAGAMSGDADGVDFLVQPHEVSFIDLGKPLRASVRTHPRRTARAISLVVPRSLVEAPSHGRSLHGTVLTGVPAVVFSQCLQSISEALPHLDFAAAAQYEDVVESLLKATVGQVAPERSFRAPPEDLRARALTYILDHLGESWLSPTTICVALAVSRAQLYRAFNDDGGIAQVIRRKRLRACVPRTHHIGFREHVRRRDLAALGIHVQAAVRAGFRRFLRHHSEPGTARRTAHYRQSVDQPPSPPLDHVVC